MLGRYVIDSCGHGERGRTAERRNCTRLEARHTRPTNSTMRELWTKVHRQTNDAIHRNVRVPYSVLRKSGHQPTFASALFSINQRCERRGGTDGNSSRDQGELRNRLRSLAVLHFDTPQLKQDLRARTQRGARDERDHVGTAPNADSLQSSREIQYVGKVHASMHKRAYR